MKSFWRDCSGAAINCGEKRVAEEMKVLGELPKRQLSACTKEVQRVSRNATIGIRNNFYSVPSQLIGERVEVRIYGGHLKVWYGGQVANEWSGCVAKAGQQSTTGTSSIRW